MRSSVEEIHLTGRHDAQGAERHIGILHYTDKKRIRGLDTKNI